MQVSLPKCKKFLRAIAPSGNLFLLVALQELRLQGLNFIAFYALQRIVQFPLISESSLCQETGLEDYEISRACKVLAHSGLIEIGRYQKDRRVRVLTPTGRGKKIHDQVLSGAAMRLKKRLSLLKGFAAAGEERRLAEATASLRKRNQILLGPLQLSFFDTNEAEMNS